MQLSPAELADHVLDLDGVLGPRTGSLTDQLRSAPGPEARFGILEGVEVPEAGGAGWRGRNRTTARYCAMQAAPLLIASDAHECPLDYLLRFTLRHNCNTTTVVI